jgi:hypothetical protein
VADSDPAFAAARAVVERCHNFDPNAGPAAHGAFVFSATKADTNKAWTGGQSLSQLRDEHG